MKPFHLHILLMILPAQQGNALAKELKIDLGTQEQGIRILTEEPGRIRMISLIPQIKLSEELTPQDSFFRIHARGFIPNYVQGAPELPVRNQLIEFPPNSTPEIRIISWREDTVRLANHGISCKLVPSQLSPSKDLSPDSIPFVMNESAYSNISYDINESVRFKPLGSSRGTGIGMLTLSPFRYFPENDLLVVLNEITFEITWPVSSEEAYKSAKSRTQSNLFDRSLQTLLYSSAPVTLPVNSPEPVKYVILSDTMFRESLQPFVNWKTRQGYQVIELYKGTDGVGHSRQELKDTLKTLYDSAGIDNPAPLFLLIAGDVEHIPSSQSSGQLTDLYYAEYNGNGDYLPELFYGRFSAADTSQMRILVEKTLQHEQYLFPDPSFLENSVLIAGVDESYASKWGNGQLNYMNRYYFNTEHGNTVYKFLYPASGGMDDSIRTVISNGASLVNYTGHGYPDRWDNPRFSKADIPNLQNADKYPVMIGNGCSTATFDYPECLAEATVRAENRGALAYIGCTNDSYWDEDYYWAVGVGPVTADPLYHETTPGVFDRLYHENGEPAGEWYPTLGQVLYAGNLAVMQGNMGRAKYYWEIYHLFGDPSLAPYFSVPREMQVQHTSYVHQNSEHFIVMTNPYIYGALSNDSRLLGARYADENGILILDLPKDMQGIDTIRLTLTGQNWQPHAADIIILPDSIPYIDLLSFTLTDITGNQNSEADYGETLGLSLELVNRGVRSSDSLMMKLVTADPIALLTDSTVVAGPADSGAVFQTHDSFRISLADSIQNGHLVKFMLEIQDGMNYTWKHHFRIKVLAPELTVADFSVGDNSYGNGNGRLDPGEKARLQIRFLNLGDSETGDVTATLDSLQGKLQITDLSRVAGTIPPGKSETLTFDVSADTSLARGSRLKIPVYVYSPPYAVYDTIRLPVGMVFEDFESAGLNLYPWKNDSIIPWQIVTESSFEGSFSARSGPCQNYDTSMLEIRVTSTMADTLSFYFRVSSEQGYDYLRFFMDGNQVDYWSGEYAWQRFNHPVPAGEHTFRWMYIKDKSLAKGADAAWIDFVEFPEGSFTQYNAGILKVFSPVPGQPLSHNDSLKIRIRNFGISTLDSLPLGYTVNDTLQRRDTLLTGLQASDSVDFTFKQPVPFNMGKDYRIQVYTSYESDGFKGNDTISLVFPNNGDAGLTRFESPPEGSADFRDTTTVSVWVRNEGSLKIEDIQIGLYVNDLMISGDMLHLNLMPGDSVLYSSKDELNLFEPGTYKIIMIIRAPHDPNPLNDTLIIMVTVDKVLDAGISAISAPDFADSVFTNAETVSVLIRNLGNYMLTQIPVTLVINDSLEFRETIQDTIHPLDSLHYTFEATVDLSAYGSYSFLVFTTFPGDSLMENDSIRGQLENLNPASLGPSFRSCGTLSVFPNPAPGKFRINIKNAKRGGFRIEVYNLSGKRIRELLIPHRGGDFNTILDLEDHPDGLYLLKIRSGSDIHAVHLLKVTGPR